MRRRDYLLQRLSEEKATRDELEELAKLLADEELFEDVAEDYRTENIEENLNASHFERTLQLAKETQGTRNEEPEKAKEVMLINRPERITWWSIAAVVTGILLAVVSVMYDRYNKKPDPAMEMASTETASTFKGKEFVVLPDGSTVKLNEGSELTYDGSYGSSIRQVFLKGEAFFNVKPDAERKFIVRSEKITTSVSGTEFNVKAFPGDPEIIVTVASGKVSVANEDHLFGTLKPDEQIIVNKSSGSCVRAKVKAEQAIAWTNEFLIINDQTVEDAAALIAARFNVRVIIENQNLKKCRINSSFMENPKLDEVLSVITTLINATYTENNGTVTINGGDCNKTS